MLRSSEGSTTWALPDEHMPFTEECKCSQVEDKDCSLKSSHMIDDLSNVQADDSTPKAASIAVEQAGSLQ